MLTRDLFAVADFLVSIVFFIARQHDMHGEHDIVLPIMSVRLSFRLNCRYCG